MPRTADFRVLASLDLDVLGCPDFGAALAHGRKLVAARHALVAVRGGLIAVEVSCRETADQNDGVEHDRFIYHVGQPTGQRHWFGVSSLLRRRRSPNRRGLCSKLTERRSIFSRRLISTARVIALRVVDLLVFESCASIAKVATHLLPPSAIALKI